MARAEAYLHAKFYLDPSNRLATIHHHRQTDRQTGQTDNDLIAQGKTVLQTVAQKSAKIRPRVWVMAPEESIFIYAYIRFAS